MKERIDPNQVAMGKRARKLRTLAGYQSKELAKFLGCDISLVSRNEAGDVILPARMLYAMAHLYGVTLDYMMCREGARK